MYIEKTCQICGKSFNVQHWRKNAKYCGKQCANAALRGKPNVVCTQCGKNFHIKQYQISRYERKHGFFCSKECYASFKKRAMIGIGNHQFGLKGNLNCSHKGAEIYKTNGRTTDIYVYDPTHPYANKAGRVLKHRLIVEQNDSLFDPSYFTVVDGRKVLRQELHVHHIDGNHDNNEVSNLSVLTRGEHTSVHNKEKIILRDKLGRITAVIKREELLGSPEVDNQQPSRSLTKPEGSETNS